MTATWQPAVVLFPNAEKTLTAAYRAALTAAGEHVGNGDTEIWVDRKIPNPRPKRLVAITRDGGAPVGLTDFPRMRFRIFDTTEEKADDLARLVIALAQQIVLDGAAQRAAVESGPYEIPDASKSPMRYALIEFQTRGVAL